MGAPRSFTPDDFPRDGLQKVSVCLPARDEEATIERVIAPLAGLVEQVLVVDSSRDATASIAREAGAEVLEVPDARGKGDSVWHAVPHLRGEVVVLLDADLESIDDSYVRGLAGPLLAYPELQLVKGAFVRPSDSGGVERPVGGGRVTELLARPVLSLFYPELATLRQPLSGQVGVRREWLAALPIWTGYGLEIGMLIETWKRGGREAIAETDLGVLLNASQPLADLGPMAYSVLLVVARQLEREGRLEPAGAPPFRSAAGPVDVEPIERPPHVPARA